MKAKLRKEVLECRKSLDFVKTAEWDKKILEHLKDLFSLQEFTVLPEIVYCYISVRGETETAGIIDWLLNQGKRVAVPRVSGKEMKFYYIRSKSDLEVGNFGIPEPKQYCEEALDTIAPVLVPGVAFSETFHRVGYGAGYYDRFFFKEPNHKKIAICYDFQLFDDVFNEEHDVSMDIIITEQRICNRII